MADDTMTQGEACAALEVRGYATGTADLAVTRAATAGSYDLSRHTVTCTAGAYRITPRAWADGGTLLPEGAPGPVQADVMRQARHEAAGTWPELSTGWDVAEILAAIAIVDRHLDDAAPDIYRTNPLANRWRRIAAGPASESQEAVDALNLATGGNPRKGVIGDDGTILGELGDTAVAALLGIQSILKDTDAAWEVFISALSKALRRVPRERPS